jgi:hypothetical protein
VRAQVLFLEKIALDDVQPCIDLLSVGSLSKLYIKAMYGFERDLFLCKTHLTQTDG